MTLYMTAPKGKRY